MTGVDLSPVMVDTARRLAGEQGVGVRFEVGDAERLPYEDASFDVVASALGVFLACCPPERPLELGRERWRQAEGRKTSGVTKAVISLIRRRSG